MSHNVRSTPGAAPASSHPVRTNATWVRRGHSVKRKKRDRQAGQERDPFVLGPGRQTRAQPRPEKRPGSPAAGVAPKKMKSDRAQIIECDRNIGVLRGSPNQQRCRGENHQTRQQRRSCPAQQGHRAHQQREQRAEKQQRRNAGSDWCPYFRRLSTLAQRKRGATADSRDGCRRAGAIARSAKRRPVRRETWLANSRAPRRPTRPQEAPWPSEPGGSTRSPEPLRTSAQAARSSEIPMPAQRNWNRHHGQFARGTTARPGLQPRRYRWRK